MKRGFTKRLAISEICCKRDFKMGVRLKYRDDAEDILPWIASSFVERVPW